MIKFMLIILGLGGLLIGGCGVFYLPIALDYNVGPVILFPLLSIGVGGSLVWLAVESFGWLKRRRGSEDAPRDRP